MEIKAQFYPITKEANESVAGIAEIKELCFSTRVYAVELNWRAFIDVESCSKMHDKVSVVLFWNANNPFTIKLVVLILSS